MVKRFSITLDEDLLEEVRKLTGARTKRGAIETALKTFVRERRLQSLLKLADSDVIVWDLETLKAYREQEFGEP